MARMVEAKNAIQCPTIPRTAGKELPSPYVSSVQVEKLALRYFVEHSSNRAGIEGTPPKANSLTVEERSMRGL